MTSTQYTLDMRPARTAPRKDGPRARQYVFPPDAIRMVNYLAMVSGRPKAEIVADAIRIATILRKYVPQEGLDRVLEERTVDALRKALSLDVEEGGESDGDEDGGI